MKCNRIAKRVRIGCLLIFAVGVLLALNLPRVSESRAVLRKSKCSATLKQIAVAVAQYHRDYGCFPPAYLAGKDGQPKHSWRVLLLPYLGHAELYQRYRFSEPWNSDHNRTLLDSLDGQHPYACAADWSEKTNYVMIVGNGTVSSGARSTASRDIVDGPSNTIAVVEIADSWAHWGEPVDLDFDSMNFRINGRIRDSNVRGISGRHSQGAFVLFADGNTVFVHESADPSTLRALATIAGGEDVGEFFQKNAEALERMPRR